MVFGWFQWFFKVVSWFFMVFGSFPWFFKVVSWFIMVFGWFPLFFKVVSWFLWFCLVSMVFQGSFMDFGWFPWVFKVVSWFIMVFGWFPWFFKVTSWFFILLLVNVPEMQKRSSRNTKMQKNKSFNSVVQPTSTSTSTNISSAFAIDVSGCAHSHHGVLNLDHHRQELSQLPGQRQPHT